MSPRAHNSPRTETNELFMIRIKAQFQAKSYFKAALPNWIKMQVELSSTVVGGVDACFADSVKFSHKSCKRAAAQLTHFSCFCFYLRPQLAAPLLLYSFTICLLEINWSHLCRNEMLSIQVNHSRWYSSPEVCSNTMQGFEEEKVEGSRDHMVLVFLLNPFLPGLDFP